MRSADPGSCFPTGRHYPGIAHLLRVTVPGLVEEFDPQRGLLELPLVCIDTETTGRHPSIDRIVELGLVFWSGGAVVERRSWLVQPGRPIPPEVSAVHGITDADVADRPTFAELAPEVLAALAGQLPVAYNAEFDRGMLLAEFERAGLGGSQMPPALRVGVEWVDPLVWARELQKQEKSRSLGDVAARLGVELVNAHRATDDAEAALRVLVAMSGDARVPRTYGAFVQEQRRLARLQDDERRLWRNR